MKKVILILYILFFYFNLTAQTLLTPFEKSQGAASATYTQCISYYELLAKKFHSVQIKNIGVTDAGYPLQLVLFTADKNVDINKWKKEKVVILVNNGIHPGEPDGIDASMMLVRDLATGKVKAPKNVALAFIAVYNIGGALNRNSYSRVNQQGPESYGFRGNAQNLDLNRDFIKSDSRNAKTFTTIFHLLQPAIFMDNHVSDGADYQHTMTLLTTQHNKLGGPTGKFMHDVFEPALYKNMEEKKWPMCPYVNFENADPGTGWQAFYEPPRYSSGYAALFQSMAFVPETHMLKPFADRVKATYALMVSMIEESDKMHKEIIENKKATTKSILQQTQFPLSWKIDSTRFDTITFMGYDTAYKTSEVTGQMALYYDGSRPFTRKIKYYNYYEGINIVTAPSAYIIPQGWYAVTDLLKLNNVQMQRLANDTTIEVEAYTIESYKSYPKPYEKHHKNYDVVTNVKSIKKKFLKGDYLIYCNQPSKRYLIEVLEPGADDSFFAWNFFDAVLQQKEGYSDYRWEDIAARFLKQNPEVKQRLEEKKKNDPTFAASASAQLNFVYKNSPYYEPAHMQYPVYRLIKK
jgi:hypothetical protein